jgi:hypothetical protein
VPEFGREVSTAMDLYSHLLDLGKPEMAMWVLSMEIAKEEDAN